MRSALSIWGAHFVTGVIIETESASWKGISPRMRVELDPPSTTTGRQLSHATCTPVMPFVTAGPEAGSAAPTPLPTYP